MTLDISKNQWRSTGGLWLTWFHCIFQFEKKNVSTWIFFRCRKCWKGIQSNPWSSFNQTINIFASLFNILCNSNIFNMDFLCSHADFWSWFLFNFLYLQPDINADKVCCLPVWQLFLGFFFYVQKKQFNSLSRWECTPLNTKKNKPERVFGL